MKRPSHPWDVTVAEATEIQKSLRSQIVTQKLPHQPRTIAGADISFTRYSDLLYACVVVFSFPALEEVERVCITGKATFPYVPGYLSFREIPLLLEAFKKLKTKPNVIMTDGQGIAHPRRLGIATHLGLLLDIPTFGCAKHLLYGDTTEPGITPGSVTNIRDLKASGEVIGALVRTKARAKPIIVSSGHLITLPESIELALATTHGYRIPEPTRNAHLLVNEYRRAESGSA